MGQNLSTDVFSKFPPSVCLFACSRGRWFWLQMASHHQVLLLLSTLGGLSVPPKELLNSLRVRKMFSGLTIPSGNPQHQDSVEDYTWFPDPGGGGDPVICSALFIWGPSGTSELQFVSINALSHFPLSLLTFLHYFRFVFQTHLCVHPPASSLCPSTCFYVDYCAGHCLSHEFNLVGQNHLQTRRVSGWHQKHSGLWFYAYESIY